ncbi:MAG: cupin domain-containing protein [Chloroflexi bacterium]|nr:cupin domain-containing protein [Chloroflexota bacterium]
MSTAGKTREELAALLAEHHLIGAWARNNAPPPRAGKTAAYWRWDAIRNALLASGSLVDIGSGGETGMRSVTGVEARRYPVYMNAQVLMPGERTQAHRNLRSETRLVCEAPPGAVFVCEFEAYPMERGDVVVSPPWTYHDHYNGGDEPAIFVDGYDNGYNPNVNVNEKLPGGALYEEITKPDGYTHDLRGNVRTASNEAPFPLPPMRYPWTETQAALSAIRKGEVMPDPYEGVYLTLASPVDGGPTLPTMAWHVQLLEARQKTLSHRHNSTTFYHVFEGGGVTVIDGERREWYQGDIFAVPPWTWHSHENATRDDAILFSIDDWPAMKRLGFYMREEGGPSR